MIVDIGKYFVYRHVRLDKNQPFYIGIGTKRNRLGYYSQYERAFEITSRNNIWKSIAKRSGYRVDIVLETNDENFVREKEKELILLYGRIDNKTGFLSNMTDGGDGTFGFVYSDELKNLRRNIFKGRHHTEESKLKIAAKNRINSSTPENINRLKIINIGRVHNKALYIERANKRRGVKRSQEYIDNFRNTRLPIAKRLRIIELLKRAIPKKDICILEHTSIGAINKIMIEYSVVPMKNYVRSDGLSFETEQEACVFMGVKPKTISRAIVTGYKCKGFTWTKIKPIFTEKEVKELIRYKHG